VFLYDFARSAVIKTVRQHSKMCLRHVTARAASPSACLPACKPALFFIWALFAIVGGAVVTRLVTLLPNHDTSACLPAG
jgi:hypothetical protein